MSYKLMDRFIYQGKRLVGRVYQHATTGRWHGRIGTIEGEGCYDRVAAFHDVAAKALGYADALTLQARNAQVRRDNRVRRAVIKQQVNKFLNAPTFDQRMDALDELFGLKKDRNAG